MNKNLKIILLVIVLISLVVFLFLYFSDFRDTPTWMYEKPDVKLIVPPEFLNGDTIRIGDKLEYVISIERLERSWAGTIWGKEYSNGGFRGTKNIGNLYFNVDEELLSLSMSEENKDSINQKVFFAKIAKILIKYYGDSCKIYKWSGDSSVRALQWDITSKSRVTMQGHIFNSKLTPSNDWIIYIDFNIGVSDYYIRSENESLVSLGLK